MGKYFETRLSINLKLNLMPDEVHKRVMESFDIEQDEKN